MKRNFIVKLGFAVLAFGLTSCNQRQNAEVHQHTLEAAHKPDTSLNYLLQAVNEKVIARIPVIKAEKGSQLYTATLSGRMNYDSRMQTQIASRTGGRIERLYIKYNYQPVKKGQLIMEVFSPELAAAQRELIFLSRKGNNQDGLFDAAKQKLFLLGMNDAQIYKLLQYQQVNYRIPVYSPVSGYIFERSAESPSAVPPVADLSSGNMDDMSGVTVSVPGGNRPVAMNSPVLLREGQYIAAGQSLFAVYKNESLVAEFALRPGIASQIREGAKILVQSLNHKDTLYHGAIGLIQPVFSAGENFGLARVYFKGKGLKAGELVSAKIPLMIDDSFWLPQSAIQQLGNQSVVYKKEGRVFKPVPVKTGYSATGKIQVLDDIANWEIASNAAYLVDSESFINVKNKAF
jgi:Cu(I)/Ag(I) efflux system membrane fusion protein